MTSPSSSGRRAGAGVAPTPDHHPAAAITTTRPLALGFTLQGDLDPGQTIALSRAAEAAGFGYAWLFDSPLEWRDPYPLLSLMAAGTLHLRLGTCVTNPTTRDPTVTAATLATLQEISGGRMDLGIGRGDSAVRMLGRVPARLAELEQAVSVIRTLAEGGTVETGQGAHRLVYSRGHRLPVWIAGYGPRAIELAARTADGFILQLGDPGLVSWYAGRIRRAVADAGRDPSAFSIQVAAPAILDSDAQAYTSLRWFPALVAHHVRDLLLREDRATLPEGLVDYVDDTPAYVYSAEHDDGYDNVADSLVDRLCITGPARAHAERIRQLAAAGADQVNLYLVTGGQEDFIDAYGRAVIPEVMAGRTPLPVTAPSK